MKSVRNHLQEQPARKRGNLLAISVIGFKPMTDVATKCPLFCACNLLIAMVYMQLLEPLQHVAYFVIAMELSQHIS